MAQQSIRSDPSSNVADTSQVSEYWGQQFGKNCVDNSLWTNSNVVARHIYRLISDGSEQHWLHWFLYSYLPKGVVFSKSLSLCCGDCAHELVLANSGRVRHVRGFDISEGAIAQALSAFKTARVPGDRYRFDVADANDLKIVDRYDLILSAGALHHVTNLEDLLARLREMLAADGYFIVLEYVGPNRFQWRNEQVRVINAILEQLAPRYLKNQRRLELSPPPLAEFVAIDPSEAVRSEDVLPLLQQHFAVEYLREFNGTLIHPLYPLLNENLTNTNAEDFDSIVRLILLTEDLLVRRNVLSSDFVFAVFRNKNRRATVEAKLPPNQRQQRLLGYLDVFDSERIAGWAVDMTNPGKRVAADLYIEDRFFATVECDAFRQDIVAVGHGDGYSSFDLTLPAVALPQVCVAKMMVGDQLVATRLRSQPESVTRA